MERVYTLTLLFNVLTDTIWDPNKQIIAIISEQLKF